MVTPFWEGSHVGLVRTKDNITAGDGAKHDVMAGKAELATRTTCNVFDYLSSTVTVGESCGMVSSSRNKGTVTVTTWTAFSTYTAWRRRLPNVSLLVSEFSLPRAVRCAGFYLAYDRFSVPDNTKDNDVAAHSTAGGFLCRRNWV